MSSAGMSSAIGDLCLEDPLFHYRFQIGEKNQFYYFLIY